MKNCNSVGSLLGPRFCLSSPAVSGHHQFTGSKRRWWSLQPTFPFGVSDTRQTGRGEQGLGQMLWFPVSSLDTRVPLVYIWRGSQEQGSSTHVSPQGICTPAKKGKVEPKRSRIWSDWEHVPSSRGAGKEKRPSSGV